MHGHATDFLVGKAVFQQDVGHQCEPVFDRRVKGLPQIRGDDRVFGTYSPNIVEPHIPGDFAGQRGGQAAFQQGPVSRERLLLLLGDLLGPKFRVCNHDALHPEFACGLDHDG